MQNPKLLENLNVKLPEKLQEASGEKSFDKLKDFEVEGKK